MKALVLAAGQGTRLKQLTAHRAKPMLPIRGKPLLHHTVAWLRSYGIRHIAVNLHYCPESIVDYFGDGGRFGVSLYYSYETTLLGTAGAAKRLEHYLDEPFIVVYGDVYTNLDLRQLQSVHAQHAAMSQAAHERKCHGLTMVSYAVPNPEECGLVQVGAQRRVLAFIEKPAPDQIFTNLAFSGVMLCEPGILDYVPAQTPFDFGRDLMPRLLAAGAPIYAQSLARGEFVVDIGTLGGYMRALRLAGEATQATHPMVLAHGRRNEENLVIGGT